MTAPATPPAPSVPSYAHTERGAPYEPPLSLDDSKDLALHAPSTAVDPKDADTPDNWVRRDPRILRLTGRHPLNCEPPMQELMSHGFITPPSLHFVRNHGPVPRLDWATHRIEVKGLVDRPLSISMDDLVAMPSVTVPVTLVCAGNRRKEENMIKKSIGFNWGACATSTSYWTGVRLRDLLLHVGVKRDEAEWVNFRGPLNELPKGKDGSYGTSVPMWKAMDPAQDVLVAYKQNHRWLTPDHGYPVRMIIPGYIGGRMVKWLSEIEVSKQDSENYYHFLDNRVLPSHVDEELANKEGWWYKPDYIIRDLNINSAVARPWHDEVVSLKGDAPYTVAGYAYTGGGRKVIRCEISLDDGVSWKLAEITRFEKPNEGGKTWCWVHWHIQLRVSDFFGRKELLCRAWDDSMNTQPAVITWNVMGMMNNCFHRIKIHPHVDADGNMGLRFQHPAPVEVGDMGTTGWREEENVIRQAILAAQSPVPLAPAKPLVTAAASAGAPKVFTMEEVAKHNSEESAWFVHEGKVYDATPFLDEHPGGAESILISTGMDATDEFNAIHSSKAKAMLADYYIGDLVATAPSTPPLAAEAPAQRDGSSTASTSSSSSAAPADASPVALNPREKIKLPLVEKIEISHNTRIFRFGLPTPQHRLGLPVGKHVFTYANINGENVMRAYTPTSSDEEKGHIDLLIKVYYAGQHPQFPEGGKMSQHFESLKIGDTIEFKGPVGHFVYEGRGVYCLNGKARHTATHIALLAGGTGITPCYQVIKAALKDAEDSTQLCLLYANQSEADILLREELDALAAAHPGRFKVWYTIDAAKAPGDWKFSTGRMCEEMFKEHVFPASATGLACMCGPPGMINFACVPNLEKMGYNKEQMIVF